MPRPTPTDRLPKLLEAAAWAFVEHGYQRTQMDDIAERLGVSKGTVYRSVESKESLFAAVIEWGDEDGDIPEDGPIASLDLAQLGARITTKVATAIAGLELTAIVADRRRLRPATAFGDEVERVTAEIFNVMRASRIAVMVVDRCAAEVPELAAVWFGDGRYSMVDLWTDYLHLRARAVTSVVDQDVLARTIVELVTTWAVKMPWDRAPRPYPDDIAGACAAMVRDLLIGGPR
jgi:AcrR family transcriptional regulator